MTPERWKQVEAVFEQALELPSWERPPFLDQKCNGDEELRREVESLLASDRDSDQFLENPAIEVAGQPFLRATLKPDERVGHYKIVSRIGAGGMGEVYLAHDEKLNRKVALKLVRFGIGGEETARRFQREAQILASLNHPNIAQLYGVELTRDGFPFLVIEYVEGVRIDQSCDDNRLSISERLKLFRQVCAAVTYAHRHTVIHRDIKPANILVTKDGEPKLLDFGIAKLIGPETNISGEQTMTFSAAMTPEYASPEQIRGQVVTTASDVYSLGVVFYQLLTGQKPYRLKTQTSEEISRAVSEQEPLRPSTAVRKRHGNSKFEIRNSRLLQGDLDNIVLMALRKEPERRYQSVEQFSEDIRRHLEARPVLARKDTVGYRAAKFIRRNSITTAAALLVLLSLLGGIISSTWEAHRARVHEAVANAEKGRAERRFDQVRQLAHSVVFDYHDAIKDLPGATRVRERLVKDALVYLDSLAAEASGDSGLQHELAAAYDRIGDVRGQAYTASLGDRAGAMDSYLKAMRIREALVAADPTDAQNRRELAENQRRIGWQLLDTSEAGHGVDYLRKAIALYIALAAEKPADAELREELAHAYNQLGLALQNRGDYRGGLDQLRQALTLRERLVADNPENREYRRRLAVTNQSIGRGLSLNGDAAGALEINQKALALQQALVTEDPANATYRRNLAVSHLYDGHYRNDLGETEGALDSYRKCVEVNEELLTADPANAAASNDLAYASQRVAELLAELGDNFQALAHYRKSLRVYEQISANAPEDLTERLYLAICRAGIGEMQARLGENTPALDECRTSISLLDEIAEDAGNAMHRSLKAQAYQELGEAYSTLAASTQIATSEKTQHWIAARDMFRHSLNISHDMESRGMLGPHDTRQRDRLIAEIAACDTELSK